MTIATALLQEFGNIAGNIAWVIALAAIIGASMMGSGAAERIVNWLILTLGESKAALALLLSGFWIVDVPFSLIAADSRL